MVDVCFEINNVWVTWGETGREQDGVYEQLPKGLSVI